MTTKNDMNEPEQGQPKNVFRRAKDLTVGFLLNLFPIMGDNDPIKWLHKHVKELAERFVEYEFGESDGIPHFVCWEQGFYRWTGHKWEEVKKAELEARLWQFLGELDQGCFGQIAHDDEAGGVDWLFRECDEPEQVRAHVWAALASGYSPRPGNVGSLVGALGAVSHRGVVPPVWLDGRADPPEVIAFTNGLLDVGEWVNGRVKLMKTTPVYFNLVGVRPYDFDPGAKCPRFPTHKMRNRGRGLRCLAGPVAPTGLVCNTEPIRLRRGRIGPSARTSAESGRSCFNRRGLTQGSSRWGPTSDASSAWVFSLTSLLTPQGESHHD